MWHLILNQNYIFLIIVKDLPCKKGRTSEHMQKIADANVKQVGVFYRFANSNSTIFILNKCLYHIPT